MKDMFAKISHRLRTWLDYLVEQKWFNMGLRTKMGSLVTVGLAGLLTIFALLGISTARQATQQVLSERVTLARLTASMLDSTMGYVENTLSFLADQPVVRDPQSSLEERQAALHQIAFYNLGIYQLDAQGEPVASSVETGAEIGWASLPAVQSALQGKAFNLSVVTAQRLLNTGPAGENGSSQPLAVIAVPVRNDKQRLSGALVALLDLTNPDLFPQERSFSLGTTGTLEVVDAEGLVLFSTKPERVMMPSDQENLISKLFVAGEPGVETCLGCYGSEASEARDEVIAFAPLSRAPWGVVVRQKAEEVFSPVRRLSLVTLVLGLSTVVGALGLVWVTTNSVINPVQQLTIAARRIAEGDLETPVDPTYSGDSWARRRFGRSRRTDEIGELSESFITMRRQLKRSIDEIQALNRELDARVQERTQAALEAQLEAQAARDDLRAVIDALSDELVVVGVDDYRVQQLNKTAMQRNGSTGEILGQYCYQVLQCEKPGQPPDCECPIPRVLETGESVKVTHRHGKPGSDSECYEDIVASPMRDASGRITRVVELSRDVTEEKRIKQSLVRRNQQLSIVNAVATTVNQSLDLSEILGRALEEVLRLTEIDAGAIFLQEDALSNLNLVAYRGLSEEAARLAAQIGMLDSSCGGVMEKGQIVIVPDLSHYRGRRARTLRGEHLSTLVHVPLMAKGSTLGSMCVGTRKKRQFSSEEQELLTAIGSQIAVAIENARLYAEVQQKEHMRGELFKKSINAQEEERKRIARELHDDTSQTLTALIFNAEEGLEMNNLGEIRKRLHGMQDLAQRCLDGVHKLIFDLRPSMLDHLGLVPALRWFADTRLKPKGVRVVVEAPDELQRLPPQVETALFRVVQEAITNIARHAAARNVNISFRFKDHKVAVSLEDDGIGFKVSEFTKAPDSPRGLGLMGMRERVELLGGELEIQSAPGHGTRLHIFVPLEERKAVYA